MSSPARPGDPGHGPPPRHGHDHGPDPRHGHNPVPDHDSSPAALTFGAGYWTWLSAAIGSEFGSTVMAFAIGWTATGFGGTVAGLVTSATMLFRTALLLAGGAAGDRYGPRRVMIACDGSMLLLTSFAAVWFAGRGASVGALIAVGCLLGVVSAFYQPASGVFPRLFVEDQHLARVMATTSSGLQIARIAGPAVGGLLLAWIGLTWVVAVNALSFLVIAVALLLVVPPRPARPPDTGHAGLREAWHAVRATGRHRILVPILIALGAVVAGTSPAMTMLFPLFARGRGWSSAAAGVMEAASMAAALVIGLTVAARGTLRRAGVALVGGPIVAGAGLLLVAVAPAVWLAALGAGGVGVGLVTFNIHAVPRFLAASPAGVQVRLQAVLGLTVTLPALVLSGPYGLLAQHTSASWALVAATAGPSAAAAVMAVTRPWLRASEPRLSDA